MTVRTTDAARTLSPVISGKETVTLTGSAEECWCVEGQTATRGPSTTTAIAVKNVSMRQ